MKFVGLMNSALVLCIGALFTGEKSTNVAKKKKNTQEENAAVNKLDPNTH